MGRIDLVAIVVSAILLGYIVESVRRRRLREEYSILWLATATILLLLALIRPALDILARALGIISPVNALFLVGFAFTTIILLHFSTVVSRLSRENRELAQRYALLVHQLEEKEAAQRGQEAEKEPKRLWQ
ncbi:MAG TPA: DUF2304 domain-containing protein [Thermomicrobiales bacterium]|jgi:hypothetical protein